MYGSVALFSGGAGFCEMEPEAALQQGGGLEGATSLMMEWEVVEFIMLLLIKVGTLFLAAAGLYFIVVMVDWTY